MVARDWWNVNDRYIFYVFFLCYFKLTVSYALTELFTEQTDTVRENVYV